jgi:hypothetical protein
LSTIRGVPKEGLKKGKTKEGLKNEKKMGYKRLYKFLKP